MIKKSCPICETREYSKTVYVEKLPKNLKDANFAGRKDPDGYHYEMLRCSKCSLLYASEIYDEEYSNQLYNESTFSLPPLVSSKNNLRNSKNNSFE